VIFPKLFNPLEKREKPFQQMLANDNPANPIDPV